MITRRATFRLDPSKTQEAKLFEARRLHAYLYNACNGVFVEVPTQKVKPSQTCPNCGHQEKKTLLSLRRGE